MHVETGVANLAPAGKADVTVRVVDGHRPPSATINVTSVSSQTSRVWAVTGATKAAVAFFLAVVYLVNPICAVPRNAISGWAYRPDAWQAERAVDLAVHGFLLDRPQATRVKIKYSVHRLQGDLEMSLIGARCAWTRLMIIVLPSEVNLAHLKWHGPPGGAGNSLISDYHDNGSIVLKTGCLSLYGL